MTTYLKPGSSEGRVRDELDGYHQLRPTIGRPVLVRLSNPRGAVEYLVGWWDSLQEGNVKPHWVFEDLKRNELALGSCEPTHWCRIRHPRGV